MKKLLFMLLMLPAFSFAQGVDFEKGLSWEQVMAKAKAENKYVFVDCFTTWCGPCKYMTEQVFPKAEMGKFFNEKFISVKVQMDKTAGDNEHVKNWYADAAMIAKEYSINAYPTFLYFSPDGKIVHRVVGGGEAAEFIAKSEKAFNPATQYYTQLAKYKEGKSKPEDLRVMAMNAMDVYDKANASKIAAEYLATQKDLTTPENIRFLDKFTSSSKDAGFAIFLKNGKKVDAVLGKGKAAAKVKAIVAAEEIYSKVMRPGVTADWTAIEKSVKEKYPQYADEVVTLGKVRYSMMTKDWGTFQVNVVAYMKKYGADMDPQMLNQFAWTVFENCPDMNCVTEALEWSKRSLEKGDEPMFMDTYANILYKLGKKEEAIAVQEKAVKLSDNNAELMATLEKMKKGEKTWK
ncbi:MAG: thioredoxin fold domain-containing protein [Chitinophaga sp.]